MPSPPQSQAELYTKMLIAVMDFTAFLVALGVHVHPEFPEVPGWIFFVLIVILELLLGIDILRKVREEAR